MIGMTFEAFLVLLVVGLVAAVVMHYLIRYRFLEAIDGFLGKVIAGWVGAWLGSPIIGHWFEGVKIANLYFIPALLGAFAGTFMVAATGKAMAKAFAPRAALNTRGQEVRRDVAA
jgi:uncharacterized membrane protein YeaQ/YmgE (transglycosylase-associated protein family)